MTVVASVMALLGLGLLPIGQALILAMLVGPAHSDVVIAVPLAPEGPPVAECDCGVPASPRGPR